MSHVLSKVWKTDKFFNVMRHGQVSSGDIKVQVFQGCEKQTGFSNLWKNWTSIFEEVRETQSFSNTWKITSFSRLWETNKFLKFMKKKRKKFWSVFEKVMKITSLVSKAWRKKRKPQVLDEPTLLQIWSVKIKFTND